MFRKRAHAGERVDNLSPVHRDVREHVADQVKEVVDFRVGAHGVLGHVGVDVGGADQDAVPHRVDQHDPAVGVFEEDFAAVARREQLRMVHHNVRTLGSAHEGRRRPHGLVGQVDPGARRVHDDVCGEVEHLAGQLVAQLDGSSGSGAGVAGGTAQRDEGDVVAGPGQVAVRAAGLLAVLEHIEGEAFGVVDRGVEVGGRVLDPRVQAGQFSQRALAAAELVTRHRAAVAGEEVVHAQAELDQESSALGVLALLVGQEAHGGGQDSGEGAEDRDRGLQRLDVVRCNPQEPVAFDHGLLDEAELAVFEVPDPAVDHVGRSAAGALAVVAALHERHVHALQGQVPEGAHPVNSASDDQDLRVPPRPQLLHRGSIVGRCAD